MTNIRKPIAAGQFYPADKIALEKEVKKFLTGGKEKEIKACIVPHAGYAYSGKLAGKVISQIGKEKNFIILGVNHSGLGNKVSFSDSDFETPFGIAKNNLKLGKKIIEKLRSDNLDVGVTEEAHKFEHSIEVELPFLQLTHKFSFVPIVLRDLNYEECRKIAEIISIFLDKETCILVSSDFTHYGPSYGFVPFEKNIKENLYKLDKGIIDSILKLDSKKTYEKASSSTVCGLYGITIIAEIAKIKKLKSKLIDYYTSGDVSGNWENSVGYAGIIFS